ncbi:histidine phosphatase family protein [Rothia sp. ZJ1223]|uniref:histidine phosphatase family protein n=1 Tax=Rothia sp. ZJ1223 TaxID=2811098 RepID=UPI00195D908B|nr:histidine phosphatase family protein [Rothia sp. ZJ1223]MBM7052055.1 histidine phosphatase family protein [Rothia sp. ZJ1223]
MPKNSASTLVLIRHGQTDWNIDRRFQGQVDIPLNATGREQAALAATNLSEFALMRQQTQPDFAWDGIITSPLSRAHETGQIIADALELPLLEQVDGLKERFFGDAEGEIVDRENWLHFETLFAGVEPETEFIDRGIEALNAITGKHAGKNIVVVSHGMWISKVMGHLTGEEHPIPENASVLEFNLALLEQ